jgi:hypothetical protein
MSNKNNIIVFSHIPKTAGTTLSYLLKRHFGNKLLAVRYRSNNSATYLPEDLNKDLSFLPRVRLISGHSLKPFIDFKEYEKKMDWFTFLRKPEKRFISHYIHQQTNNDPQYKMSLADWSSKFNRKNWMVRMIAGEENLEKAIEILENKFLFVGLTEKFDESLEIMKSVLNLPGFDTSYTKKKMTGKDSSLKEEIYNNYSNYEKCIKENNVLDSKLYEYVRAHIWPKYPSIEEKQSFHLPLYKEKWNLMECKIQNNLLYKPFLYFSKVRT